MLYTRRRCNVAKDEPVNVISERFLMYIKNTKGCEWVCLPEGDVITETPLSVFSGKIKYPLRGRAKEKVRTKWFSKKTNTLCDKHIVSYFIRYKHTSALFDVGS